MEEQEAVQKEFDRFCLEKEKDSLEEAVRKISRIIRRAQELEKGYLGKTVSFNHIVEYYYYTYYECNGEFRCAKTSINRMYRELAHIYQKAGDKINAERAYKKCLQWDPVDGEAYLELAQIYKETGNLKDVLKTSQLAYKYCNSRPLLAGYYRNLGFYYLECYQPELSRALYEYSECYSKTQCAQNELEYLASAMGWTMKRMEKDELLRKLKESHIPVDFAPVTVALTYKAAKMEEKIGHTAEALECYELFYHQLFQKDDIEKHSNYKI